MTSAPRLLIVEDNPSTRKLLRIVLADEGFSVSEAPDGRTALERVADSIPDIVLQDIILPDMNGFELVRRLRKMPGLADIPILALSGFVGLVENKLGAEVGFTSLLVKPIEPARLVEVVRSFLPKANLSPEPRAAKRRLLIVDDDPVQLKLQRLHFTQLGFDVTTAQSGEEALRIVQLKRPEVILSDVLMPGMDGFELCYELRRSEALGDVPVVLLSAQYRTEVDQELAARVGANALVCRTPEFTEARDAILHSLKQGAAGSAEETSNGVKLAHAQVLIQHLERRLAVTSGLVQRCTFQAAQLSLLGSVADALAKNADPDLAMREVLAATLDAAGISKGALLIRDSRDELRLRDSIGFTPDERQSLDECFGQRPMFQRAIEERSPFALSASFVSSLPSGRTASAEQTTAIHVVPLVSEGRGMGAMVLAANRTDVTSDDAVAFARAMGNQMVQSFALANAFARLSASEARYRTLLESASDAIAVLTPDGVIREVNRKWEEITGKAQTELTGRRIGEFAVYHGETPNIEQGSVTGGESATRPVQVKKPDGSIVLLEFSINTLELEGEQLVFAVARDVTAQVRAQEQLFVSDRMASVGSLAAAVAHEINNPLAAVVGNLELTALSVDQAIETGQELNLSQIKDDVEEARSAADRVRSIVRDLRIFSRAEPDARTPVDLHKLLDSSLRIAGNEIRHRARIVRDYGSIPYALSNESRLSQVFLNLIVNAAQAIPEGHADVHEIRIRTSTDREDGIVVEIEDTGSGIPKDVLAKVFDPFFTTKGPNTGTGLGLAICHRLVTALGGQIHIESTVGKGTTFRVALPATAEEPRQSIRVPAATETARRARILVVDDEAMIGKMIKRYLSSDHDVTILTDAGEALTQISGGVRFDVILCDMMMPNMSGIDLYTALCSAETGQADRMIFMTGGAFTPQTRAFLSEVPNPRLEKPFQLETLRALINKHFLAPPMRQGH
jgi:PAS domain S-box-containing protein